MWFEYRSLSRRIPAAVGAIYLALALSAGCRPASAPKTVAIAPTRPSHPHPTPDTRRPAPNPLLLALRPSPRLYERDEGRPEQVALTFDAGSDDSAVTLLLKTLTERHLHVTFFLTGKFCEEFPHACRAIADAGMEIGNHSYSHPHFTRLSREAIVGQLNRGEAAIKKACGRGAKPLFRFPYGDCDPRTRASVAAAGYQAFGWSLDSLDSVGKHKSADYVAGRILRKIQPGYVTLMHVSCVDSARALPRIFDYLDRHHPQVVPVSQLLLASADAEAARRHQPKPTGRMQAAGMKASNGKHGDGGREGQTQGAASTSNPLRSVICCLPHRQRKWRVPVRLALTSVTRQHTDHRAGRFRPMIVTRLMTTGSQYGRSVLRLPQVFHPAIQEP